MTGIFEDDRHETLRVKVRRFAQERVAPRVAEMEATRQVDRELSALIAAQGWIGVTIPEVYGGMGLGHLAKTIIIEELARVSGAMGAMVQASQLGVAKILHFGSEEQRLAWLPQIAAGRCLPTIAVTEAGSGGHVLGMCSSAVRDGAGYVLNGAKVFVGNSHIGDLHGVVARTGPGSGGLTAFLVEADHPGVRLEEHAPTMGLSGFSFGTVIFENCWIPDGNRLGNEGDGLKVAYSSSTLYGRPNLAAVALGIHRAVVEDTVAYCARRELYGKQLSAISSVAMKLGDMQSRLMTARLALYHATHLLDKGLPCDAELMNAKLINTEYAIDSARAAMEIFAARGLHVGHSVERYLRDAYHIYAPAGTSDIQRLRLFEYASGTNREQWSVALADRIRADAPADAPAAALAGSAQPVGLRDSRAA
ncbi:MAG TPA: acyl-CoA dehydrogenase family protein [Actinocrinis sp.]|jgi:alkylation response protein AidB-like acyl-CoA dehydrogenase|uniref:acyl-CoA dehydrogenase family protein n=1 Tax=Actinocrinis sp. TaxID=1920516 RepID=UPI002DDD1A80|nr:acyl-CoA dehydrogenase family protein [Actinocrinis sp.]HEV3169100.1 acyl-CoA dehydrogenase family protein [Actinocrinis sp.]